MPRKKILRIRNCGHTTVISYFRLHVVCKSLSRKFLGLKLIQLDCVIIHLYLHATKKARNALDEAGGLPLVQFKNKFVNLQCCGDHFSNMELIYAKTKYQSPYLFWGRPWVEYTRT